MSIIIQSIRQKKNWQEFKFNEFKLHYWEDRENYEPYDYTKDVVGMCEVPVVYSSQCFGELT